MRKYILRSTSTKYLLEKINNTRDYRSYFVPFSASLKKINNT